MAATGHARRTPGPGAGRALTLLALAVLAGHLVALAWMAAQWRVPTVLKPMVAPLLTRTLAPQAPVFTSKPATVSAKSGVVASHSIATSRPAKAAASAPPVAGQRDATAVAEAAQPPASAAVSASAPVPSAEASPPTTAVAAAPVSTASAPTPAASAAPPPTVADLDAWPADTRLRYRVTGYFRGDLHGDGSVLWQRDRQRYQVKVEVNVGWLASFVMTSQGTVSADGLLPNAYEETQNGKRRRTVLMQDEQVVYSDGQTQPRPLGIQDTASQFVELSHRFASGETPLAVGSSIDMWLARPGGADKWTYDVVGKETLYPASLPPVEAFHLKPRPLERPRGPITAELWFAPTLQHLPVRILMLYGPDARLDLLIDRIEQR